MTVQDQPGSGRRRSRPGPKRPLDDTEGSDPLVERRAVAFTQFSIDRVADPAFWMDASGRLIYVNQAACHSLGYSRDELLGMTIHEIDPDFPSDAWPPHWDELRQKGTMQFESHHRSRDGRVFPVEISANFIEFDGKQYNCAFARDISDRKQAEAERQRLLDALQEKNRELQNILFIASHDLRSPLVNVQGFAGELERTCARLREILVDTAPGDPAERAADVRALLEEDIPEALGFIRSGIERIDSLVAGLLRLARIGSAALSLTQIDMNELMASVVHTLRFQITQTQAQVQVDPLPPCRGDCSLLEQVFINLIDNAIKYRKPDEPCCIRITATTEGPTVVYSVADNGIGIDPNDREKIFELFYRLQPDQNTGDGLGLTIVKRILDRLDGHIRVDSEPDRGSTFHVSLKTQ